MTSRKTRFFAGLGLQVLGYGFGAVGAALLVVCALLSFWIGAGCGVVLLALGAFLAMRGEDLEG